MPNLCAKNQITIISSGQFKASLILIPQKLATLDCCEHSVSYKKHVQHIEHVNSFKLTS
jgi:hypothetical protein